MKENEALHEFQHDDEGLEDIQDEPELEITDLDEGKVRRRWLSPTQGRVGSWFIAKEHRGIRTLVVSVVGVLTVAVLLFNLTPIGTIALQLLPKPQQTNFPLNLEASPNWGELQVDGQRVIPNYRGNSLQFSVSRGEHRLRWLAAPFSTQDCVITLPAGTGSDTCNHPAYVSGGQDDVRSHIIFSARLGQLSQKNLASLFQAAQAALDHAQSSEIVHVGDVYTQTVDVPEPGPRSCNYSVMNAAFCFVTAKQPLHAKLNLQLDMDLSGTLSCKSGVCRGSSLDCQSFCDALPGSGATGPADRSSWQPLVLVRAYWQFTQMNGRGTVDRQPNTFILGAQNEHFLRLEIRWSGQAWNVTSANSASFTVNSNPVCDSAFDDIYTLLFATKPPDALPQLTPGPNAATGCLIRIPQQASLQFDSNPPSLPLATAYVVQRFGVLLAVNNTAHRRWPFLPVADASTQHLVQQWIAQEKR